MPSYENATDSQPANYSNGTGADTDARIGGNSNGVRVGANGAKPKRRRQPIYRASRWKGVRRRWTRNPKVSEQKKIMKWVYQQKKRLFSLMVLGKHNEFNRTTRLIEQAELMAAKSSKNVDI